MDYIRKTKCSRCSCKSAMEEIKHYKDNVPKNDMEAMALDEILSYGELEGELFQCYMDNNGTKCKGLDDFTKYLRNNKEVEDKMILNLNFYKKNYDKNNRSFSKLI